MIRDEKLQQMDHYFTRMRPLILNEHNMDILTPSLNQFIDEVKGEIETWSERGSGWIMDKILEAFINVAQYQPMRGGSYMPLPAKLKNKKAVLNIHVQNRDNKCLRWAIRAALFQPRGDMRRTSIYPTEDGLNFTGIDFPTPVSQIDRLERQNQNLAINVFGRENGQVVVHRISGRGGEVPGRKHALQPCEKAFSTFIRPKQTQWKQAFLRTLPARLFNEGFARKAQA